MRIAIYGAGKFGQYVLNNIESQTKARHEVVMFIDNSVKEEKMICNKQAVSVEMFLKAYTGAVDCVFVAVLNKSVQQMMALSLYTKGYIDIYMVQDYVFTGELDVFDQSGKLKSYIRKIQETKPVLPSIGYKIINTCNLKCKRCVECSNIAVDEKILDVDLLVRSLDGLKKKFSEVWYIFIKGGEPFLNPHIEQYLIETRNKFPYATIRIITNGLLLTRLSESVINAVRDNGIEIGVSEYPPTRDIMDKIIEFGLKNEIAIFIEHGAQITQFEKILTYKNEDYVTAWKNCNDSECHLLSEGRIYTCSIALRNYDWQDYFGLKISKDEIEECSADILKGEESGWDILAQIGSPSKICRYCSTKPEYVPWEINDGHVCREEWIVKEE